MADIFISYSRLDHDRVQPLAERLISLGYSIWWDKHLRRGQAFVEEIERQIGEARCVLTVWSLNARNSTWVWGESCRGLDTGKLLQVRIDGSQPPTPFDALGVADLSGDRAEWGPLEDALAKLVRQGIAPQAEARRQTGAPPGAGTAAPFALALGATAAAYAGALAAAYNGVMSPDQLQLTLTGAVGVAGASAAISLYRLTAVARAGG